MQVNQALLDKVRSVIPYTPGDQPQGKVIKLNTNENPYPPSPRVAERLQEFSIDQLRLYPDPTMADFVSTIASYHNVHESQVFIGIGSDDVIAQAFMTYFSSGKKILFPDVTYSFYEVWADLFHIPYERPSLNTDFMIHVSDYQGDLGGIIFPNPNAPTGIYEPLDKVEEILKANPDTVVIVDEAYIDFAGKDTSAVSLLDRYPQLIVVRTYSKSRSMAGMRIGYALGHPELIKRLLDVKYAYNSYTLSQLSFLCGITSIEEEDYFQQQIQKIVKTRQWFEDELTKLGFEYLKSSTNFVFAKHPSISGAELMKRLKNKHIYVRHFAKPKISDYLRISIGTDEEMGILRDTLYDIVS